MSIAGLDLVAIELEGFVERCSLVARAHGVPREVFYKLVHRDGHVVAPPRALRSQEI